MFNIKSFPWVFLDIFDIPNINNFIKHPVLRVLIDFIGRFVSRLC